MEVRTADGYYQFGPMFYSQCIVPKTITDADRQKLEQYFTTVTSNEPEYTSMYVCSLNTKPTSFTVDSCTTVKEAIAAFESFKRNCTLPPASVVVWDLDETIIRDDDSTKCEKSVLAQWRMKFDYMVLWSNGVAEHVSSNLKRLEIESMFDMTMSRSLFIEPDCSKPYGTLLKQLNKKFGIPYTTLSVLVDDMKRNFDNDYDVFVQCEDPCFDFTEALLSITSSVNADCV